MELARCLPDDYGMRGSLASYSIVVDHPKRKKYIKRVPDVENDRKSFAETIWARLRALAGPRWTSPGVGWGTEDTGVYYRSAGRSLSR